MRPLLPKFLLILLLVVTGLLSANELAAQRERPKDYGISSRRALKRFQDGREAQKYREYPRALEYYEEALEIEPGFTEARARAGACLFLMQQQKEALPYLEQAHKQDPDAWPMINYYLGVVYFDLEKYAQAVPLLEKFMEMKRRMPIGMVADVKDRLPKARFAAEAMANPVEFDPKNLGPAINSPGHEYMPSLTADGQMMFFTSRRRGSTGGYSYEAQGYEEDFYVSVARDTGWAPAENLGPPINTEKSEGASCVSPDGRYVYFTGCHRGDGAGSCDIYVAEFDGKRWSAPQNLGAAINTPFWESYPSISNDGNTLFFASRRRGNVGNPSTSDIWYSSKVNGQWQPARNLGKPINTPGDESAPFIHADDQTLYFSSNHLMGFGGMDLFKAERTGANSFSEPENLGYPLNSPFDDRTIFVTTDGETGYLNSDRYGGMGKIDIYSFTLDPRIRPRPATFVRGIVLDSVSGQPVASAHIAFINLTTNDTVRNVKVFPTTGRFLLSLPMERDYAAYVEGNGYLFHSENFSLKNLEGERYFDLVIELKKPELNTITRLENIFFDFDKSTLQPASEVELEKLLRFLENNPTLKIELRGHTDDRGSEEYNQELSEARAQRVKSWLVERGIAQERLTARGFGESQPEVPNTSDENRARNRRTEFRIVAVE